MTLIIITSYDHHCLCEKAVMNFVRDTLMTLIILFSNEQSAEECDATKLHSNCAAQLKKIPVCQQAGTLNFILCALRNGSPDLLNIGSIKNS